MTASAPDVTVIFETVYGSPAYGLATESSDTDLRGVFVPAPLALTGYLECPDQLEHSPERVLYEVRKFFRLAAVCNPTVIEALFTDPEVEILSSGNVVVRRPDAKDLLAVRRGALPFDALLEQAEALGSRLKALADGSPLPPHPDEDRLSIFCAELVADVHGRIA